MGRIRPSSATGRSLPTIFTEPLNSTSSCARPTANDLEMTVALQALWQGLLYDPSALDEASASPAPLTRRRVALREAVARDGLAARCAGVDVLGMARDVSASPLGLQTSAPQEVKYLDVLRRRSSRRRLPGRHAAAPVARRVGAGPRVSSITCARLKSHKS